MKLGLPSSIYILPDRQRKDFDLAAQNELGESIQNLGLFHAPVLRVPRPGEPMDRMILVSGERRLRAINDIYELGGTIRYNGVEIPRGMIPYTTLGDLTELEAEEAEYDENFRRRDLTWQEQAMATAKLTAIRTKQAEAAGKPAPTVADIALELRGSSKGSQHDDTRKELIVARYLADPEVKAAKTMGDAFKLLKKKEDIEKRVQLAAKVGQSYNAGTAHQLVNKDCLDWMASAQAEQFDVILTDPPYGIGADEFGDAGGKADGAHFYADDYETWRNLMVAFASESFRLAKPEAHLYAFCDITRFDELKGLLNAVGWRCFRTPIIWHKPNGSRTPWVNEGPQRRHELVLYAQKGRKLVTQIYGDVVTYATDINLGHPAQKPVDLYIDLLRRSVSPGDSVLDPFAGSCPILVAATTLKCKATAIEQDAAAFAIGVNRLKALTAEPELPGLS